MRYYKMVLNTNAEMLEERATVDFKEFRSEPPIIAMNNYTYKHLENGLLFFAYREEGDTTCAVFAYDEQKHSFRDAHDCMTGFLSEVFQAKQINDSDEELTLRQLFTHLMEGRRREHVNYAGKYAEDCNMDWLYAEWRNPDHSDNRFTAFRLDERIISREERAPSAIYDPTVVRELANIEENECLSGIAANPVHYVISARGMDAAWDITDMLTQRLLKAKRIDSRRMTVFRDVHPEIFMRINHLEDLIANNRGGVIMIDLSAQFAHSPTEYGAACEYLAMIFKRFRNQCLFVFTYNMDKPGFAYQFLPLIRRYAVTIALREGTADRNGAAAYLKELIRGSENAAYAGQAEKFMNLFPEDVFSQTDVFEMFEKFDSWCLNENVLHAYDFETSDAFLLDRDECAESSYDKLHSLIGLRIVKQQIDRIIASDIVEHERKKRKGRQYRTGTMHMVFAGSPGTAKTTVARLFAGIAKEKGILKSGAFVSCGGMDLNDVSGNSVRNAFKAARGGVLFIDEAYSLCSSLAITALIQELENQRDDVIVVLAGYGEAMKEFMKQNEGLKSRLPHWVDFPDYSADELSEIFASMLAERGFHATDEAVKAVRYILEKARTVENFGNGRYVRNLLDRAAENQSVRLLSGGMDAGKIAKNKLFQLTTDDITSLDEGMTEERAPGSALKELDALIGLSSAKKIIHRAIANYKMNRLCLDRGIPREKASLHMVFTGNPGTAKTTVARLFAEILKDEKVLSTGAFVEVGRKDLVGVAVGHTAPLVQSRFRQARGGVLFIDEAYSLCDGMGSGYGDEAINTIVQEMENYRDEVIVIFAGYPGPMRAFLARNPGMRSRVAFQVRFDDYSTEELCEITKLIAGKKGLTVTEAALAKLKEVYEVAQKQEGYGNGRFVRKMLEEAEMNLAERITEAIGSGSDADLTAEMITTIDACDIPQVQIVETAKAKRPIGFQCYSEEV